MKLSNVLIGVVALTTGIDAVATPRAADLVAIDARAPEAVHPEHARNEELWKRKGGGGGGGRGGSGSGRGGGGSSGGSGGGSRGGGGSSGRGGASDNTGGRTTTGTGPQPAYRGYYPGGAAVPYRAGSTISGIAPALLGGVALATIAFGTYHFINGAYAYPYTHPYYYHNATTNMNETKPVTCLCDPYNPCACEDNGDQTYFNSVIGNGTSAGLNQSIVAVAKNETTGNETIYINGGLPNGTTAAGGTDVPDSMAAGIKALAQAAGWWPVATVAFSLAFLL